MPSLLAGHTPSSREGDAAAWASHGRPSDLLALLVVVVATMAAASTMADPTAMPRDAGDAFAANRTVRDVTARTTRALRHVRPAHADEIAARLFVSANTVDDHARPDVGAVSLAEVFGLFSFVYGISDLVGATALHGARSDLRHVARIASITSFIAVDHAHGCCAGLSPPRALPG